MSFILIADDIAISRDTLARVLRDAGHRVMMAADGDEALERARGERPDMAVLDLNMPRMTGLVAAPLLKTAYPGRFFPVMILSGRALSGTELSLVLATADDFLRKPYAPAEVCARIEVWLRTSRLFEERPPVPPEELPGERPPASFAARVEAQWRRAQHENEPFALLLCETPADTIRQVSRIAGRVLRQLDILGEVPDSRLGVLLPNTLPAGALCAVERLRTEVRDLLPESGLSMGLVLFPGRDLTGPVDLHRAAEAALGRAREQGPFSLCLHQHQGYHLVRSP